MASAVEEWRKVDENLFHDVIKPRGRPAVLRGLVSSWPAVARGRQSSTALADYIRGFHNGLPVPMFEGAADAGGRFFYNDTLTGFNFESKRGSLYDLLDRLDGYRDATDVPSLYAGSLSLQTYLPGFAAANPLPDLVAAETRLDSIWIGNRTVIAPHYDNTENIACVVAGRRRFTLFPPDQIGNLYPGPPDLTPAGQTISLVDTRAPDLERFPLYAEALTSAEIAELEPGDAIYIPTLWWHGVESLTAFGVLVNSWWRDVPDYFETPARTLLHALLSLKSLPPQQRQAWKQVFDYLIFQDDGPALPHLSPQVRGLYGDLTPEKAARLKAFLAKSLSR